MRFVLPSLSPAWGKYVAELVIVAAGVALGLAATQWAEDRQVQSQVNDAYDVLSDELGDNLTAVRYRHAVQPCIRGRTPTFAAGSRGNREGVAQRFQQIWASPVC